jgi:hypothetical protein
MSENAIWEQMNGRGQGRTGWEMKLVEWDWFWKSRWHTICELWMVGEWLQDFFKILLCSFEQDGNDQKINLAYVWFSSKHKWTFRIEFCKTRVYFTALP